MSEKNRGSWIGVEGSLSTNKFTTRRKIEFVRPVKAVNNFRCIQNGPISNVAEKSNHLFQSRSNTKPADSEESQLESKGLFPLSLVLTNQKWKKVSRAGPGLYNHGNTCFLNSTLQCLLHTPSLVQILQNHCTEALKGMTHRSGQQPSMVEYFQKLVVEVWSVTGKAVSPRPMVQNIRRVGRQFRPGRQEDAHEYLRQLLDCMHEEILKANGIKVSDGAIAETSFVSRIFGGYLCNELKCSVCKYCSRTLNHFQDLSLEITGRINSIDDSLRAFMKTEILGTGNEWLCGGCNKKVKASKQMKIHKEPRVLVLHLKRFSFGSGQGKINKSIKFEETLELPCEVEGGGKVKYHLHGLVVHHGNSEHSGHYVAFVKAANGQWHEMNDSTVSVISISKVLSQQAYILFYGCETQSTSQIPQLKVSSHMALSTKLLPAQAIQLPSFLPEPIPLSSPAPETTKKIQRPLLLSVLSAADSERIQVFGDTRPCRLKQLLSWTIGPVKFLGNVQKLFGRWKIGKLQRLRNPKDSSLVETEHSDLDDAVTTSHYSVQSKRDTIVTELLNDAKRSRIGGSEGIWDNVDDAALALVKKRTISQRQEEQKILTQRKPKDWDAHLDSGRVKKVKVKKEESEGSSWDDLENPFQNITEQKIEFKFAGGFSQKNSKKNKVDADGDFSATGHGRGGDNNRKKSSNWKGRGRGERNV